MTANRNRASVGRQGFWEYYRHTGDAETIGAVYPAVKRYLRLWEQHPSGLVAQRPGGWTWGDWGTNKDLTLLYNGWYALALEGGERMAELMGDADFAADCRLRRERVGEAFNRAFWTPAGYRSADHTGPIDERGAALAVVAGIVDVDKHPVVARVLCESRHASPYMEKYVLETLLRLGRVDLALRRMRDRFGPMIDSPTTMLWEGWGIGPRGYGGGSYNHAWSGGVLTLLSQYVAGIDPLEPGYGRVAITPQLGDLGHAAATVVSPLGPLTVRTTRVENGHTIELSSPAEMTCVVTAPSGAIVQVRGGNHRWEFTDIGAPIAP